MWTALARPHGLTEATPSPFLSSLNPPPSLCLSLGGAKTKRGAVEIGMPKLLFIFYLVRMRRLRGESELLHYLSRLLSALLEQEEEPSSPSTYKTLVNIAATLFRSGYFYPASISVVEPEPEPELFASAETELEP
jgi:hypothetical protein